MAAAQTQTSFGFCVPLTREEDHTLSVLSICAFTWRKVPVISMLKLRYWQEILWHQQTMVGGTIMPPSRLPVWIGSYDVQFGRQSCHKERNYLLLTISEKSVRHMCRLKTQIWMTFKTNLLIFKIINDALKEIKVLRLSRPQETKTLTLIIRPFKKLMTNSKTIKCTWKVIPIMLVKTY